MRVLCVCALVFGHMYVRMHVYTCTHVQMAMRLYMYNMMSDVCICSCTPMSISFFVCRCMFSVMLCSLIDVSMHACVCVCRGMGYCMCVYTQTHTHTHTHTHTPQIIYWTYTNFAPGWALWEQKNNTFSGGKFAIPRRDDEVNAKRLAPIELFHPHPCDDPNWRSNSTLL